MKEMRRKGKKSYHGENITFHGGAEQAVADVRPSEIHAEHGQSNGEKARGRGPKRALEGVGLGVPGGRPPEGGHWEAHEEGEGRAGEGEAGAVAPELARCP